jgi:hypothetical protein
MQTNFSLLTRLASNESQVRLNKMNESANNVKESFGSKWLQAEQGWDQTKWQSSDNAKFMHRDTCWFNA